MKRVLHCFASLDNGGVEAFVMNVYRNINTNKIQFDFLLRDGKRTHYWDEIEKMGGRIYVTPSFPRYAIGNYRATKVFLQNHKEEYDIVHVHANSLFYMAVLRISTKLGYKTRIIHSHNSQGSNAIVNLIHKHNKKKINKYANVKLACSEAAAKWMYLDDCYTIIKNGIDAKKYKFDPTVREKIRKELGISNKFVIGNIGRFVEQKNHKFIIKVFYEYQKKNSDSILLLIGFGSLENSIREEINHHEIADKVLILNDRNDPYNLLQAMDLFLFPSLFEGFGISLLEAQAAGLFCICSSVIPNEVLLSEQVKVLNLDDDILTWVKAIELEKNHSIEREKSFELVVDAQFDIERTCEQLLEIYNR